MLLDALKELLMSMGFGAEDMVVLSASPESTEREHGVPSISRNAFLRLLARITTKDLLISGPGGLFQDVTGPLSPAFYSSHVFIALLKGAKVLMYGQSLGPIRKRFNLYLLKLVCSCASLVVLRDENMSDIVPKEKLLFTPDPSFVLTPSFHGSSGKGIAFVFRKWKWPVEDILSELLKTGLPVTLVSFQGELESQEGFTLSERYDVPFIAPRTWIEALGVLSSFKVVVGMRLHSLIMSAMSAVPFVGLSYDPKVRRLCEAFDMPFLENQNEPSLVVRYVRDIMVKWDKKREALMSKVGILKEKAKLTFKESLELLYGEGKLKNEGDF